MLLLRVALWLLLLAGPVVAQNNWLTPGGAVAPGVVDMCLNGSGLAVPCAPVGGTIAAAANTFPIAGVGNGIADDTAVFTAALAACGAAGGGVVTVPALRYLINSASLTVPAHCILQGTYKPGANLAGSKYTPTQPAILLNGAFTINVAADASLEHLAIFNAAANALAGNVSTAQGGLTYVAAFAGTAITIAAPTTTLNDLFVIGFTQCVSNSGGDRFRVNNFIGDCTNGLSWTNVQDVGIITNSMMHTIMPTGSVNASTAVSGAADNGGIIRLTVANSAAFATGNPVFVFGVGGFTGANGRWTATVVNSTTVDLTAPTVPTATGTGIIGSYRVAVSSTTGLGIGQTVSGTGIGTSATIQFIDFQASAIYLTVPNAGAVSGALTIANPAYTSGGTLYLSVDTREGVAYQIDASDFIVVSNSFEYGWETGLLFTNTNNPNHELVNFACDMEQVFSPASVCVKNLSSAGGGISWIGGSTASVMTSYYDTSTSNSNVSDIGFTAATTGTVPISINADHTVIANSTMQNGAGQTIAFGGVAIAVQASATVSFSSDYFPYAQLQVESSSVAGVGALSLSRVAVDQSSTITGWLYSPANDNFLINPGFQIDQTNEGSTYNLSGNLAIMDGWREQGSGSGATLTIAKSTTTAPNAVNEMTLNVSVGGSVTSGGFFIIEQRIEGSRLGSLGWGTANAQPVSLSFQQNCTLAGTYAVSLVNGSTNNRVYVISYTLPASVWTQQTFTIPGDIGGTWVLSGTGYGLVVNFPFTSGSSNVTSTFNAWQTGSNVTGATGQVQVTNNTNAICRIANVKLEQGPRPTVFVARNLAQELNLDQRYYVKSFLQGTRPVTNAGTGTGETLFPSITSTTGTAKSDTIKFPVPMAASPSITFFNPAVANANCRDETATADGGAGTAVGTTANGFQATCTVAGTGAVNDTYGVHWTADSRL